jgi:hypothetical protein
MRPSLAAFGNKDKIVCHPADSRTRCTNLMYTIMATSLCPEVVGEEVLGLGSPMARDLLMPRAEIGLEVYAW